MPGSLSMGAAIIILQVQINTRLPVERFDNYKITGAEEYLIPVQRCGSLYSGAAMICCTKGAGEYKAAFQGCSSY